ncbi:hypothetical protein [Vibrio parahaemolyticus]|uniref:hypothetical protein n=2 Tax=Vibrio parahaemolyticus TaxID=670 RepID=UPI0003DBD013|nr:hypothetical protein [Vibrio parahaemolyticus]EJV8818773.1 hypothetical protein [Vibrio parahaemolyticus]ETJ85076.1 hypothetical protein D029_4766 [Vibrio parahaemolyticus 970107]
MAQQNSTLTLSKCQTATNVSPLERESSPKNDVSLSEVQVGFIQLVDCNSEQVLAQREGVNEPTCFEYLQEKVWNVTAGLEMRFVEQTEVVHPYKFFCAVPKASVVKVYHNQLVSQEPVDVKPVWQGLAAQLEESRALIESAQWDAFDLEGNWIGTSEY